MILAIQVDIGTKLLISRAVATPAFKLQAWGFPYMESATEINGATSDFTIDPLSVDLCR